jgi:hypothetical protein
MSGESSWARVVGDVGGLGKRRGNMTMDWQIRAWLTALSGPLGWPKRQLQQPKLMEEPPDPRLSKPNPKHGRAVAPCGTAHSHRHVWVSILRCHTPAPL